MENVTVKIYKAHKVQNGSLWNINYAIVNTKQNTVTMPYQELIPVSGGAKESLLKFLA